MTSVVNRFDGPYAFLSNFAPASVTLDGVVYPTVENAFQAAKTLDLAERVPFTQCAPKASVKVAL